MEPTDPLAALERGATVLAPNRRLARAVREQYQAARQAAGDAAWATPAVLPWGAWLQQLWQDVWEAGLFSGRHDLPTLLHPDQERALWQQTLETHDHPEAPLVQAGTVARRAREAWRLVHDWGLQRGELRAHGGPDTEALLAWATAFEQRCDAGGWLDGARLPARLSAEIAAGNVPLPPELVLYAFEELTPAQTALLEATAGRGTAVARAEPPAISGEAVRTAAPDRRAELYAAARWARTRVEASGAASPRVGVVVPDLGERREEVARIFSEVFAPGPAAMEPGPGFELSLGRPLADWPLVHTALQALELAAAGRIALDDAGHLLRSPFLGGAEAEASARGALDAALRRRGSLSVTPGAIAATGAGDCPDLTRRLGALRGLRWGGEAGPGHWAAAFGEALSTLGWPGERSLSSAEFQTMEAFYGLLEGLGQLEPVHPRLTARDALARLRQHARETIFQPEGQGAAPVHVLGALEAAGLTFDHLWVGGLDDRVWPEPARPNPLLPIGLQRARGLAHASAERELAFARRMTSRLAGAAREVVFSHPGREGDQALRPSPLITDLPEADPAGPAAPDYAAAVYAAADLEVVADGTAPPFAGGRDAPGGTALFRDQADCPFRAFANHRLRAEGLEEPAFGPDAMTRGKWVHRVLERLWGELKDSAGLAALSPEARTGRCAAAVATVLDEEAARASDYFTPHFRELEQQRLTRLAAQWLEIEAVRPPFTVERCELPETIEVGGLTLNVRIDRVDRVEGAGRLLVDYKTGEASWRKWAGERPKEPQLPLYAAFGGLDPDGLAFASLKPGTLGLSGLARQPDMAPGLAHFDDPKVAEEWGSWEAALDGWRKGLAEVAGEFRAGRAEMAPRDAQACRYCDLVPLCRIHELEREEADDG